jgi:hypothetical protein
MVEQDIPNIQILVQVWDENELTEKKNVFMNKSFVIIKI